MPLTPKELLNTSQHIPRVSKTNVFINIPKNRKYWGFSLWGRVLPVPPRPQGRAPGGPPFFRGRAPKGKNPNIFGFFGIFMIFFVFDTLGSCLRVLGSYLGVNGTEHKDFKIFRFFRFHRVPPMLTFKCYFRGAPPEKGRSPGAPLTGNPAPGSRIVAKNRKLALTATGTGLFTGNTGYNHWILLK